MTRWAISYQSATQQNRDLLDHLVGEREQGGRYSEAKHLRRLGVDYELEFHRCLHRKLTGLGSLEDAINIARGAPIVVGNVRAVGHKAAALRVRAIRRNER